MGLFLRLFVLLLGCYKKVLLTFSSKKVVILPKVLLVGLRFFFMIEKGFAIMFV